MTGRSKLSIHPAKDKILEDIAQGVSNAEVARRYGLSESAISRAKIAHLDTLSRELTEDSPTPSDLLARLADLADSTRKARVHADTSGSPQTRARAQANELGVLDKLLDRIGVTDLSALRLAQATGVLVRTVSQFVRSHPEAGSDLLDAFGKHEALLDLRDVLRAQLRNKQ